MTACTIKYTGNPAKRESTTAATLFGKEHAGVVRAFHKSMPAYAPTALVKLDDLASHLGIRSLYVKDESSRFGLNAFKALGGSYCVARVLAQRAGIAEGDLTFARLREDDVQDIARAMTLITATDGNHGRGIAWTARELGAKAVVYMPKGSSPERLQNIRNLGAHAEITDVNYDDTVRLAKRCAEENGWVLVQDTAWQGYEEIPTWIMQG